MYKYCYFLNEIKILNMLLTLTQRKGVFLMMQEVIGFGLHDRAACGAGGSQYADFALL